MSWFGSAETLESKIEKVFKKSLDANIAEAGSPDAFKNNVRQILDTKLSRVQGDKKAYELNMADNVYYLILKTDFMYSYLKYIFQNHQSALNLSQVQAYLQDLENGVRQKLPALVQERYPQKFGKIADFAQRIDEVEFTYLYHLSGSSIMGMAFITLVTDHEVFKTCKSANQDELIQLIGKYQMHYLNHRIGNRVAAMGKAG